MSLSDAVFAASWAVLCDRFGRQFNDATVKIYRRTLSEELTDEEFSEACRAAFRLETFFPSPQKLVDYGKGGVDFETRALREWDACMGRVLANEPATLPETLTRRVMNQATNGIPLGNIPSERLHWVQKEFTRRYVDELAQQARNNTLALTNGPRRQELPHASD